MDESPCTHATILVGLFPSDEDSEMTLDEFLRSIQRGLKQTKVTPPHVHCLYFIRNQGSYKFRLLSDGNPVPLPTADPTYRGDDIPLHLKNFLESPEVCKSITTGDKLYMIIGAHGEPEADRIAIVIQGLRRLGQAMFSFRSRPYWKKVREASKDVFRPPPFRGKAFETGSRNDSKEITLTELANSLAALKATKKPLQTLMLHCCFLSSLETAFELSIAEHHIACESFLKGLLDVSLWFDAMANNSDPQELTKQVFKTIPPDDQFIGILNSHWSINRANPGAIPEYIVAVNKLGSVLDSLLSMGHRAAIDEARLASRTNGHDLIDVWSFAHRLTGSGRCGYAHLLQLNHVQLAILNMVIKSRNVGYERDFPLHQGLSVYFPKADEQLDPPHLPHAFKTAAAEWKAFLEKWRTTAL